MGLRESLERRLEEKGLEHHTIPGFMRSLAQALSFTPHASPQQVQKLMRSMGWNVAELDAHTLQLAMASLKADSPAGLDYTSYPW
jgi:hypothetical protein